MQDVKIIAYTRTATNEIECQLGLNEPPMLGEQGLALLIQIVIINLLKTPGQDFYEPQLGGGLLRINDGGTPASKETEIQANISQAIAAVENQIKRSQLGQNYPKSERLARLGLAKENSIFLLSETREVIINIELANEAGDVAIVAVPISDVESGE